MQCHPGDSVLFYTDGIVDSSNAAGEEFGIEHLTEVVLANSTGNANAIVKAVINEVAVHTQSESHIADQTLIALKVLEPHPD